MQSLYRNRQRAARWLLARGWKNSSAAPVTVSGFQRKWWKPDQSAYCMRDAIRTELRLRSPVSVGSLLQSIAARGRSILAKLTRLRNAA